MNLVKEVGAAKDFFQHLLLFITIHVVMFFLLQTETPPSFLEKLLQWIKEGEIWYYDEESGIFITGVWLIILVCQGGLILFKPINKR
ncbi:hypothetical protein NV379_12310 [Paenibacillus sp. N1-5-1-14]|uniref:hypothetical protein n=1 Tax=Paenibacillus radicibacter TaxID=2972488 RepID=UPI0021595C95|nr:hypothetical protein [Paenibacillus radicibacter]MCR8643435.1 hypothetical protein [Paenibacillus radicibacter]